MKKCALCVIAGLFLFTMSGVGAELGGRKLWLIYHIGLADGAAGKTDGVVFKVEVAGEGNGRTVLGETEWDVSEWRFCKVDLSKYAGKRVAIRFITDPGMTTNYDWACWGDIKIIEGDPPMDNDGETLPSGTKVVHDLNRIDPARTGIIREGKDVTPIDSGLTGATFVARPRTCGGVEKMGYEAHPGWKGESYGCPSFGEFEVDLK